MSALLALSAVGCKAEVHVGTSTGGYDHKVVERQIVAAQKKAAPGIEVGDASCPDKVEAKEGVTFPCTIEVGGVEAPYQGTITKEGEDLTFKADPAKAIISTAKATSVLEAKATSQGLKGVTIDCGSAPILVLDPGDTFDCTLDNNGATEKLTLKVTDTDGNLTIAS